MRTMSMIRIVLICIWVFVLSGCQSESNRSPSNTVQQDQSLQQEQMTPTEVYDHIGLSKYETPINVTFLRELSSSFEELVSNLPGETSDDNRWTRLYRDTLGINISYDWTAEGDYYRQNLNFVIASGQITDVIRVSSEQLSLLNSAGLIQDLTNVYDEYATPLTKNILSQEGDGAFHSAMIDGKLMGIPETGSLIEETEFLWIRTDWLEELKLSPPKTIEEVIAVATAFTEQDPDRNGLDDTYGLAATSYLWDPVMGIKSFMAGYHAFPELWLENEDGKLVYGGIQPEVKDGLKALQQMYDDGILDEEFSLKNGVKVREYVENGKIGMLYGQQWAAFLAGSSRGSEPNSDWKAYPIVAVKGSTPKIPLKFNTSNFYAVKKGFQYPEAVVKMFNLHLEKNWGESADYETYYSNPYPVWQLSPVSPSPARKNFNAYLELQQARETGIWSELNPEAKAIQKLIDTYVAGSGDAGWGWNKIYGVDSAFSILQQYEANDQLLYDRFTGARTETMIEAQSILNNLQHETYINIILGNSVDEFDAFVQKWNDLGGAKITEEVNQWYEEHN